MWLMVALTLCLLTGWLILIVKHENPVWLKPFYIFFPLDLHVKSFQSCRLQREWVRNSLLSLLIFAPHKHKHSHLPFFSVSLSPLHNQTWFPPNRKTSLFPPRLRLSAILCGPGLNSARGQKYPPMAPLNGTGHIDHRRTALKIQRSSATAPLVHSLALNRLRS